MISAPCAEAGLPAGAHPELAAVEGACPACGSGPLTRCYRVDRVPVHSNELHASREAALSRPTGCLDLGFCHGCGFIANLAYDATLQDYTEGYEDSQAHSARFDAFAGQLVAELLHDHDLAGRRALEIGCGRGDFLLRLVEAGMAGGVGIDPAWRESEVSRRLAGRAQGLPECYAAHHAGLTGDLVFCRHTLEHIPDVRRFVRLLRANLAERRPVVYFEVPDTERILLEGAFWDVYYEHCSYFTAESLERLFRSCDFEILRLRKGFGEQYLLLEARPAAAAPADAGSAVAGTAERARQVACFASDVAGAIGGWRRRLDRWQAAGQRVVLWGSGSKAVGFLTALGGRQEVLGVVDINPAKQGSFLPGSGHRILAPSELPALAPDRVVTMNAIYTAEIRTELAALGLHPELHTV